MSKDDMKKKAAVEDELISDDLPVLKDDQPTSHRRGNRFWASYQYGMASLVVVLLAAVVLVLFGLAPTRENIGAQVYSATAAEYFPTTRLDELYNMVKEVAGQDIDIRMVSDLLNDKQVLVVTLKPGASFPETAVTERLNAEFPYLKLGYFEYSFYQPVLTWNMAATIAMVLAVYLIILFFITGIMFNGRNGLIVISMVLHDLLLAGAFYVLLRLPNPNLLIAAGILACLLSPYFSILKLAALEKHSPGVKTRRNVDAFWAMVKSDKRRSFDMIIVAGLLLAAFLVVGLIMKVSLLIWIGVAIAAVLATVLYSSNMLVTKFWEKLNPFVIVKETSVKAKKG